MSREKFEDVIYCIYLTETRGLKLKSLNTAIVVGNPYNDQMFIVEP